jgi:hypothetical protein
LDGAQTAADLREITLRTLAAQGQIFRTQDEFDIRIQSDAAARPVPLSVSPASAPICYRVIYPSGNDRYELTGASEEELNAKNKGFARCSVDNAKKFVDVRSTASAHIGRKRERT